MNGNASAPDGSTVAVIAGQGVYVFAPAGANGRVLPLLQVQKFVGAPKVSVANVGEQESPGRKVLRDRLFGFAGNVGVGCWLTEAAIQLTNDGSEAINTVVYI